MEEEGGGDIANTRAKVFQSSIFVDNSYNVLPDAFVTSHRRDYIERPNTTPGILRYTYNIHIIYTLYNPIVIDIKIERKYIIRSYS